MPYIYIYVCVCVSCIIYVPVREKNQPTNQSQFAQRFCFSLSLSIYMHHVIMHMPQVRDSLSRKWKCHPRMWLFQSTCLHPGMWADNCPQDFGCQWLLKLSEQHCQTETGHWTVSSQGTKGEAVKFQIGAVLWDEDGQYTCSDIQHHMIVREHVQKDSREGRW